MQPAAIDATAIATLRYSTRPSMYSAPGKQEIVKRNTIIRLPAVLLLVTSLTASVQAADDKLTPAERDYFENHVRPVLVERCLKCHGASKQEAGLRLDAAAEMWRGGDQGAVVVAGQPQQSPLIQAVRYDGDVQMPPDGKLDATQISALEHWVKMGAPWPDNVSLAGNPGNVRSGPIGDAERAFWSFQPIRDPAPPTVDDRWIQNDIDRFLLVRLQSAGLIPAAPAARRTWIRRATFDLTGLPPSPEEIQAFLQDESPQAYDHVIDRLLASPRYGERWGRHWLDVVRYADTAGETADYPVPEAYRFRNWVIDAVNLDLPYDQFLREQLAGDILAERLWAAGDRSDAIQRRCEQLVTATGFIAISRRFGFDPENYHDLTIQDTLDTLGQAVLGLSLGCAHCHDHKYDPINTEDYYAWFGIFESTRYAYPGSESSKRPREFAPLIPRAECETRQRQYDEELARVNERLKQLDDDAKRLETELAASPASMTDEQKKQLEVVRQEYQQLAARRNQLQKSGPYPVAYGVIEGQPQNARVRIRGERQRFADEVPRRNLAILGGDPLPADAGGSGRVQLADWLTRPDNPLTARVMVNRIWQHHFGQGLVTTANDFGVRGQPPSHPELLDWLASRFGDSGWSLKAMHRLMMSSAAYQMAAVPGPTNGRQFEADPENRLLRYFPRRRLSAEELRDALLLVSGTLDLSQGQQHPFPAVDQWGFTQHAPFYAVYESNRRSVYLMQQRLKRHPFLALFDGADPNASTGRRTMTTVPTQALFLMNDALIHQQSQALAAKLLSGPSSPDEPIAAAYEALLGRLPSESEFTEETRFLEAYSEQLRNVDVPEAERPAAALAALLRTLYLRNEFLFVE
jgi:hypothetical protein